MADDVDDHIAVETGIDDDDDVDVVEIDDGLENAVGEHQSHFSEHCAIILNALCCGGCALTNWDLLGPMRSFVQELLSPWILTSVTFGFMLLSSTATMMGTFGDILLNEFSSIFDYLMRRTAFFLVRVRVQFQFLLCTTINLALTCSGCSCCFVASNNSKRKTKGS